MSARLSIFVVYAAGLLVGVAVVLMPSASNVFRDTQAHALSAHEYGLLFVPMILGAIAAATVTGPLAARHGLQRLLLAALGLLVTALALLAVTAPLVRHHALAFRVLLVSNAALGGGFGGGMTALNSYAPRVLPRHPQSALTALHATVGVGTILPPIVVPRLAAHGIWWSLPLALALTIAVVAIISTLLPLDRLAPPPMVTVGAASPASSSPLWRFCVVAAIYGILEALFGDWAPVFLHEERMLDGTTAGLALSLFWAAVTAGRVGVAIAARYVSPRAIHITLPIGIAAALLLAHGAAGATGAGLACALGGLGCSSFLPLTIGAAAAANPARSETAAGLTFAAYLAGNGAGGAGVGLVRDALSLSIGAIYLAGAAVAVALVMLAARSLAGNRAGAAA
jgi:MFS family permease